MFMIEFCVILRGDAWKNSKNGMFDHLLLLFSLFCDRTARMRTRASPRVVSTRKRYMKNDSSAQLRSGRNRSHVPGIKSGAEAARTGRRQDAVERLCTASRAKV